MLKHLIAKVARLSLKRKAGSKDDLCFVYDLFAEAAAAAAAVQKHRGSLEKRYVVCAEFSLKKHFHDGR